MLSFPQSNTGVLSLLIAHQKSATLRHSSAQAITLLRHAPPPLLSPRGTKCLFGLQRHGTKCHTIAVNTDFVTPTFKADSSF